MGAGGVDVIKRTLLEIFIDRVLPDGWRIKMIVYIRVVFLKVSEQCAAVVAQPGEVIKKSFGIKAQTEHFR